LVAATRLSGWRSRRHASVAESTPEVPPAATKRQKSGMNGEIGPARDEIASAIQSSFRAIRRKSLARRLAAAYSSHIAATNPTRKDRIMNATFTAPTQTRITAFAAAILTSTVVLGATVLGMQSAGQGTDLQVVALERVVVSAPAAN
jgi:hypothetical protein